MRNKSLHERATEFAKRGINPHIWEALCDDETDDTLTRLLVRAYEAGWGGCKRHYRIPALPNGLYEVYDLRKGK